LKDLKGIWQQQRLYTSDLLQLIEFSTSKLPYSKSALAAVLKSALLH
jgi:hypothetical protein